MAASQHGVVSRQQLLKVGISSSTITDRIRGSALFPVFPGVYAVGRQEIHLKGHWQASVLAAGKGSMLSGRSASTAWGFLDHQHSVNVNSRTDGRGLPALLPIADTRIWPYLFIHRPRMILPTDSTHFEGIPIVTVSRAQLELPALVTARQFRSAFAEADRLGLLDDKELLEFTGRTRGRKGGRMFRRAVIRRIPDIKRARSILEGIFLELRRDGEIRRPEVNVKVLGKEMDFVWRDQATIVEVDGWEFHRGIEAFEEDALENNRLRASGWTVLRFTWRMVTEQPGEVREMIRKILADSGHRPR